MDNKSAVQGLAAAFKLWALCLYELPREDAGAQAPVCTIDARPHPVLRTWVSGQPTAWGMVTDDRSTACTLVRAWRPWWKGGGPWQFPGSTPPSPWPAAPVLQMDSDASLILVPHLWLEKAPLSIPIGLARGL